MLAPLEYHTPTTAPANSELRDWLIILSTSATLVLTAAGVGTAAYFFLAAITK